MKKLLIVLLVSVYSVMSFAQEKDVTKFLGIPVDGTKSAMIAKLKAKGFVSSFFREDVLSGVFNDYKVFISVVTNNQKVRRITVWDQFEISEADIKKRFNNLCYQFSNNDKYEALSKNHTIPSDEDISYNMIIGKKYEAYFIQKTIGDSSNSLNKVVWFTISELNDKYRIIMYYDNVYNEANGEDL